SLIASASNPTQARHARATLNTTPTPKNHTSARKPGRVARITSRISCAVECPLWAWGEVTFNNAINSLDAKRRSNQLQAESDGWKMNVLALPVSCIRLRDTW